MIKAIRRKLRVIRPFFFMQILFTIFAFALMCIFAYYSVRNIMHEHLTESTQNMLNYEQSQIENDLTTPKVASGIFSATIKNMLLQNGTTADDLHAYVRQTSNYMKLNNIYNSSFGGILCYFEKLSGGPIIISDLQKAIPSSFDPTKQAWYQNAVNANGTVSETIIENDPVFYGNIMTYSYSILDNSGGRLGVICFAVHIDVIGNSILETTKTEGGFGVLLGNDLTVLAYPDQEFLGKNMNDPDLRMSSFSDKLVKNGQVTEQAMTNSNGKPSIAFFRVLDNGWYLGAVIPKNEYFRSMTNMAWLLAAFGAVFAGVLIVIFMRIDKAKNKADFESKQKSAFLANMSHEIRTPLNAIIGMTDIGKSSAGDERKDYCFTKIEDASHHLLAVINDILDMSKIEAGMFLLSETEYNFEAMLESVVGIVNFRIDEKNQKLTVNIDKNIPKVLIGDDQRLAQVITNLLGNANKFTPNNGAIMLRASLLGEKDGVCEIKVEVTDSGIGISPEQQKKLFQAFRQAEASTTRKFGGTGLGLAISKRITEMMGGSIWVDSELGKGATFSFTILAKRGKEQDENAAAGSINWGGIRVMAVDDDPDILTYFKKIMNDFGAGCDTAESGAQALELVEKNGHYDVYFVDWQMPGMDGIALSRELKARIAPYAAVSPIVILISAAQWNEIEEEAQKAGVDEFIAKPLFPKDIAETVGKILGVQQKPKESEQNKIDGIFEGKHIILAEDVEINREIVITLLEPTLINIDSAENGSEAVRLFTETPDKYNLILMDVQMPEMDGYDATRGIRALGSAKSAAIPIIALTANVFQEDIEQCVKAGMNDHLGKPIDFDELVAKLRKYL